MLQITRTGRIADVIASIRDVPERVIPYAASTGLTRTAKAAEQRLVDTMPAVFDRPTPYTLRSLYTEPSTKETLSARVAIKSKAGNSAIPSERFLEPEVFGGRRSAKRFERALTAVGVMAPGLQAVTAAGSDLQDAYGNLPGRTIQQLLAYFQAFRSDGFKANTTAKRKAALAKKGRTAGGAKTIRGFEYFASFGQGERAGRRQHLPAGIWRRRGVHGSDIAPVLLFVRRPPTYRRRLDFAGIAEREAQQTFPAEFAKALEAILARGRR